MLLFSSSVSRIKKYNENPITIANDDITLSLLPIQSKHLTLKIKLFRRDATRSIPCLHRKGDRGRTPRELLWSFRIPRTGARGRGNLRCARRSVPSGAASPEPLLLGCYAPRRRIIEFASDTQMLRRADIVLESLVADAHAGGLWLSASTRCSADVAQTQAI